jgi:ADP-ribose pyrophosphatase YjhB (NUDIX family)
MYRNPIVTIDTVTFCWKGEDLLVLLEQRAKEPFEGAWAVPGGFIHTDEDDTLASGRDRILKEKVGFLPNYMEQVAAIGSRERDPREWSVSIVYLCILSQDNPALTAPLAENLQLAKVSDVINGNIKLAFDHRLVVKRAYDELAIKTANSSIPLLFMPAIFTLPMIMALHKEILGHMPNKMSLYKRYQHSDILSEVAGYKIALGGRSKSQAYTTRNTEPMLFGGMLGTG